jgi:hypothetical protein
MQSAPWVTSPPRNQLLTLWHREPDLTTQTAGAAKNGAAKPDLTTPLFRIMIILMRAEGEKNETKAIISGTYIIVTFLKPRRSLLYLGSSVSLGLNIIVMKDISISERFRAKST